MCCHSPEINNSATGFSKISCSYKGSRYEVTGKVKHTTGHAWGHVACGVQDEKTYWNASYAKGNYSVLGMDTKQQLSSKFSLR